MSRRNGVLLVSLSLVAAALVLAWVQPWSEGAEARDDVRVEEATLRPGEIVLSLRNDSDDPARIAQVIVNDAFVDFRGSAEEITVSYPWVPGESYEVEVMTSTGATIEYEIEEAEAGTRAA